MSSSLAERLRGIVRPASSLQPGSEPGRNLVGTGSDPGRTPVGVGSEPRLADGVAELLGGAWAESRGQRYVVVDRSYGPGYRHGRIAMMDAMPPWPRLSLLGGDGALPKWLFLDLETTGVAGGAGTYAFLIGCGWFDGPTFRVRQFFLSSYGAEIAMLEALAALAADANGIVTFNGKSFDVPLIETRYVFHRQANPFAGALHVDMLHPARRLWRADEDEAAGTTASCRLSVLEQTLCGLGREGDVPGFEIPARYFRYVRSGDARPLEGVLEHNRLDLLSLALLTARASQLLDEGPAAARTGREALGLGFLYERGALFAHAREAYAAAADLPCDADTRAHALRSLAVLCRRERRFAEAAAAWQRLLDLRRCPLRLTREATEALAIHHEHRARDPFAARQFAEQSLRIEGTLSRQHAVRHRLARLDRKLQAHVAALSLFALEADHQTS